MGLPPRLDSIPGVTAGDNPTKAPKSADSLHDRFGGSWLPQPQQQQHSEPVIHMPRTTFDSASPATRCCTYALVTLEPKMHGKPNLPCQTVQLQYTLFISNTQRYCSTVLTHALAANNSGRRPPQVATNAQTTVRSQPPNLLRNSMSYKGENAHLLLSVAAPPQREPGPPLKGTMKGSNL